MRMFLVARTDAYTHVRQGVDQGLVIARECFAFVGGPVAAAHVQGQPFLRKAFGNCLVSCDHIHCRCRDRVAQGDQDRFRFSRIDFVECDQQAWLWRAGS